MMIQQKNAIFMAAAAGVLLVAGIVGGLAYSGFFSSGGNAQATAQIQTAPGATLTGQNIAVIEGERIMRDSKAGIDIRRQLEAYGKQIQSEIDSRQSALKAEQQKMQQQAAILSASSKAQQQKAFDDKVAALQKFANDRQGLVQGGLYKAQLAVNGAMKGVTDEILRARGAGMLMDKSLFMMVSDNFDVTNEAIQKLDSILPSVKVELVPLPPEVRAAAERQQQLLQQQQQQR